MRAEELKTKFLNYFESKGHKIIPSASLIPSETDPTVLFTTAGMHPLVPYLIGEKHPEGKRLVNLQRCVRTGDIDEVGDESHLTFFEMMGYWSLGDYWKKEAIEYIFEFLTIELGLDPKNFAATCFEGDEKNGIPRDMESYEIWRSLSVPEERIVFLGYQDNWWGPAGTTGPCGPDTELFVWTGKGEAPTKFDPEDKGWMELCNDVFMQYNKTTEGKYEPLAQKNVDFGMGYERLLAYLNHESDIYKTELFWPIIDKLEELSGKKYDDNKKEFRIIADHLKASLFIYQDGIDPSKEERGSVLRKLIRKAIEKSEQIHIDFSKIAEDFYDIIVHMYQGKDLALRNKYYLRDEYIFTKTEEKRLIPRVNKRINIISRFFNDNLDLKSTADPKWLKSAFIDTNDNGSIAAGKFAYQLWNTMRVSKEKFYNLLQKELNGHIDQGQFEIGYNQGELRFKELSRTASAGMFKGGLADAGDETKKLHTAAHLMLEALRRVLGDHVVQKGSNITAERLRFDFSHPEKMTDEQKKQVEDIVNEQIKNDLPVTVEEMTVAEADKKSAMGAFKDRYGEKVKVYTIGNISKGEVFSKEICGGPHVTHTGELGHFTIKKEESSSAGVRRIKAVLL